MRFGKSEQGRELSPCFTLGLEGAFRLQGAEDQGGSGHNWSDQSCGGRDYIKSTQLPRVPVSWGVQAESQPEAIACVGISCHPRPPLCNVFDSAHVIVQVRGWSGPRGSGHVWTTPTQVLFVLLILFASRH